MFERLLDLILQLGDQLIPFFVVDPYQHAGVLRLGKYNRTCPPGFHWKIPFADRIVEIATCTTTLRLPPQTLTTKDGKSVVVTTIVKYNVADLQPYITDIFDQQDALADTTMGAVRACVREATLEDLVSEPPEHKIAITVRRHVKPYGINVQTVTFADLAAVRSFRLVQQHPKDIEN